MFHLHLRGLSAHALPFVAQGRLKAPVTQAVLFQHKDRLAAGFGGLHIGFFTQRAEVALRGLHA